MFSTRSALKKHPLSGRPLLLAVAVMAVLLLGGCGSTNVYKNDKTVLYNGAVYNLSNVTAVDTKISGKLSDTRTVNLKGADNNQIEAYLDEYNIIYVRMAFDLDGREMLYQASSVENLSEYSKMHDSFENASKQINDLLADKKKMQLKLK